MNSALMQLSSLHLRDQCFLILQNQVLLPHTAKSVLPLMRAGFVSLRSEKDV